MIDYCKKKKLCNTNFVCLDGNYLNYDPQFNIIVSFATFSWTQSKSRSFVYVKRLKMIINNNFKLI